MSMLPTASHPQIHQFSDAVRLEVAEGELRLIPAMMLALFAGGPAGTGTRRRPGPPRRPFPSASPGQRLIPSHRFGRVRIAGQPLAALDDLVHAALVDAKLEGDLLLRHARGGVKLQDPTGQIRGHLAPGDAPRRGDRALGLVTLAELGENGERHVHAVLAQSLLEFLERGHAASPSGPSLALSCPFVNGSQPNGLTMSQFGG